MKVFLRFFSKRLIYLVMLAFSLTASCALLLSKTIEIPKVVYRTPDVAPLPILKETSNFPVVSAQGVIVVDVDSGVTLYEKNADTPLLPASTTKIITALVAMDYYSPDEVLEVIDPKVDGQKMGLISGEKISVKDLLAGLLIYSANDAAVVLAQNYPGGENSFVLAMNLKARELSLEKTHFVNPTGLDGTTHVSTARDMVRLAKIAMQNPEFAKIVATEKQVVTSQDGRVVHRLTNINELLGKVDGVLGVKTGWTENARENLITYIKRNNNKVLIAVLGSQDRFGETKELIDWVYKNYEWKKLVITLHSTQQ